MTSSSRIIYACLAMLFAVSLVLFIWPYGYIVSFQSETNDCFFLFGRDFALEFISHPGCAIRYAGRFLGQFYYVRVLGALVVSAGITCFGFLLYGVLQKCKKNVPAWHVLLPCVLLLSLHTSTIWLPQDTLGLCMTCVAFLGYLIVPGPIWKRGYALAVTAIVYLCAGAHVWILVAWITIAECLSWTAPLSGKCTTFATDGTASNTASCGFCSKWRCPIRNASETASQRSLRNIMAERDGHYGIAEAISEAFFRWPRRSDFAFVVGYVIFSVTMPLIAWRWLFPIPLRSVLACPIMFGQPFRTGWPDQTVTHFASDCTLAVTLCGLLLILPFSNEVISARWFDSLRQENRSRRYRVALVFAVGISVTLLLLVRYDARLAAVVSCRQLYKAQKWDALLEAAENNPYRDHRIQFMTNFALYRKGKLLDEMFRYPQPHGTRGLFMNYSGMRVASPIEDDTDDGMYNSDLLYDMGHVNFAFRHAFNCRSLHGRTYENLTRIAECSIANGNVAMARKYLNVLDRTLFYRSLAHRYLRILADPDAIEREFGMIRELLPTVDGFGHPTRLFLVLLESKSNNRMAFEYLMAWLLLEKTPDSLESVSADTGHLRDIGRTTLPRHCQEAVLLRAIMTRTPVDSQGFRFDRAVVSRAEAFQRDIAGQGNWLNADTARTRYGDTYMYYWFFETVSGDVPSTRDTDERFSVTTREE